MIRKTMGRADGSVGREKSATMKDIAEHLGVSINTVHKAVAGKPGLSEATRRRILAYAKECRYRRNESASSLRRKNARVLGCLPTYEHEGRYFFADLWSGCRRYASEALRQGCRFELLAFDDGDYESLLGQLIGRIEAGDRVDGVLASPPTSAGELARLQSISDRNIPLVLVNGDHPDLERIGAVMADYVTAGRLMAEQTANLLRGHESSGRILLLSGNPRDISHYRVVDTFHGHLRRLGCHLAVDDIPGERDDPRRLAACATAYLRQQQRPALACSVFAVGSKVLAKVLRQEGLAGVVPAIGSDVFVESVEAIEDGTFTNVVYKDPAGLGYGAAKMIGERVLWGSQPVAPVQTCPVELVFKSNLERYRSDAKINSSFSE